MRKNKKYRYTAEEQAIHEEAMRLRKMTDRQLVEQFHRAADMTAQTRQILAIILRILKSLSLPFQKVNARGLKGELYTKLQNLQPKWG